MKPNEGYPYLENAKADIRLLGTVPTINPHINKVSSQRGMMTSTHMTQAQLVRGCEVPRNYTGFESLVGKYEYNPTRRSEDVIVVKYIPKYNVNTGANYITYNPSAIVITRGMNSGKIDYFETNRYTMRADGYGYQNIVNWDAINEGMPLMKETTVQTSPAHDGPVNKMFGTNLNVCYLGLPQVTEDAFVISESAAKKLQPAAISQVEFDIAVDQIPLNLYGDEENYKFIPDLNETVRDDGILCALRRPTADSIISDTTEANLIKVQDLHDTKIIVPAGSRIVDLDIWINRKTKSRLSENYRNRVFAQAEKYRSQLQNRAMIIYNTYMDLRESMSSLGTDVFSDKFNTLVTNAISELLAEGVKLRNIAAPKNGITYAYKRKPIEFIHVRVTYVYDRKINRGNKIAGRYGNKGVVADILPDDHMPTDEEGNRADVIIDPISVFNRMNPGQWYEIFINRMGENLTKELVNYMKTKGDYNHAFNRLVELATDVNPKYGELIARTCSTFEARKSLVDEIITQNPNTHEYGGIYLQNTPFQKEWDTSYVLKMRDKWNVKKSYATFTAQVGENETRTVTFKEPVLIGYEYFFVLYKIPHLRACGLGYVNQFRVPMQPSGLATLQSRFPQSATRWGEDEIRNLTMSSGSTVAARILGAHAYSKPAIDNLATHLLNDKHPSQIQKLDISTDDIIKTNAMSKMAKHIFSCLGVDISPDDQDTHNEEDV